MVCNRISRNETIIIEKSGERLTISNLLRVNLNQPQLHPQFFLVLKLKLMIYISICIAMICISLFN